MTSIGKEPGEVTVRSLIDALMALPEEMLDNRIILAADREANKFSPLDEVDEAMYVPNNSWSGDVYVSDYPDYAEKVLVLWPVN